MDLFEKYKKLNINGELISLEYREIYDPYFCYPVNAKVIGFEGTILYCFLPEYGDMVFASNPESCADIYVYPIASNFEDFIRLILACGSANPAEQVIWMNKEQFNEHLTEEKQRETKQQRKMLSLLQSEFNLIPMINPFEYVKALQKDFDYSKIRYGNEYYDLISGNNANFEFEHVFADVRK